MGKDLPATQDRLTQVVGMILAGAVRTDIVAHADKEGWDLKRKEIDNLIERAHHEIGIMASQNREEMYSLAVVRLQNLWARAMKIQDYKTALNIQKELNRLYGF